MDGDLDIALTVLPLRLTMSGVGPDESVVRLRGVWGAALKETDPVVYDRIYEGVRNDGGEKRPAYVAMDGGADAQGRRLLDWTLVGSAAISHHEVLRAAWRLAGGSRYGIGRRGARRLFNVDDWQVRQPDGRLGVDNGQGWDLRLAQWPLSGGPAATPCRIAFPSRLHIMYSNRTVGEDKLTWRTVLDNACRRLSRWVESDGFVRRIPGILEDGERRRAVMALKQDITAYYSGRQRTMVSYHALSGHVDLPDGPGPAWPVLLCARWLGLGRHFTQGFGRVAILPLD